jgi:hypothetical protein
MVHAAIAGVQGPSRSVQVNLLHDTKRPAYLHSHEAARRSFPASRRNMLVHAVGVPQPGHPLLGASTPLTTEHTARGAMIVRHRCQGWRTPWRASLFPFRLRDWPALGSSMRHV